MAKRKTGGELLKEGRGRRRRSIDRLVDGAKRKMGPMIYIEKAQSKKRSDRYA